MDEDSVVFRRIPKFADDYRRFPEKTEDVSNIYHTYLRVQSPESRVQSPESRVQSQSPVLVLDYAVFQQKWTSCINLCS